MINNDNVFILSPMSQWKWKTGYAYLLLQFALTWWDCSATP